MTKTTMRRLVAVAKKQGHTGAEAERIARAVAESLAERRQPKTPPEWVGCR